MKMKKGDSSSPDGKAASQVHFFDRPDASAGLSGEVAADAPLSRDVKEGEPYQIQGGEPYQIQGGEPYQIQGGGLYQIQGGVAVSLSDPMSHPR